MRIIPVLDLKAGQAVLAVAGNRQHYQPLRSLFARDANPITLAQGLRDDFGATQIYIADLDAIVDRVEPAYPTFQAIADLGIIVWADAGIEDDSLVSRLIGAGVRRVIAGLETSPGPQAVSQIVAAAGPDGAVFSLDLQRGVPILAERHTWAGDPFVAANVVAQVIQAGVRRIIRLDLAEVGTGRGVGKVPRVATLGPADHRVEWITGGGVATASDLATLARLGYSAALVGSAIHDGRIRVADWLDESPAPP